jgi:hypothetical protein
VELAKRQANTQDRQMDHLEEDMKDEYILCAAIWVDTGEAEPPRRSYSYPETGLLFTGWRHPDCFVTLNAWAKRLTEEEREAIGKEQFHGRNQGFLTSTGRFVDRKKAFTIAAAAGQIDPKLFDRDTPRTLISEDLY